MDILVSVLFSAHFQSKWFNMFPINLYFLSFEYRIETIAG